MRLLTHGHWRSRPDGKGAVVPGTAFGENGAGFCRACFATSYEQLIEASNRIERHVQSLAAKS
jgi:aspartate/methionine/tyrosine aminotransferase